MPSRLSLSIFLSFVAVLIAFYSGFVFSQVVPGSGAKPPRNSQASLSVSVNVVSVCSFQIGQPTLSIPERSNGQNAGFSARCSLSQPLVVSPNLSAGGPSVAVSQAQLQVVAGSNQLNAQTGTPYWAEAFDKGLLVTF